MKFVFHVNKFFPREELGLFQALTLRSEANTVEEAYTLIESQIPEGHRIWMWWEDEGLFDDI